MSVTTPTGLSGNKDKSRRKRNKPVKIDVSMNENSPSSPIDPSLMTITSNESTPILVIRSDSKEDSPDGTLVFPPDPSAAPVTPIFTPTLSSQSMIPHISSFDNDDQQINVTDTTTIIPTSQVLQGVETPLSMSSDQNNSREDLNKSTSSEGSAPIIKPEHILNPNKLLSVNIAKNDTYMRESISHGKTLKSLSRSSDEKPHAQCDSQKNDSYCWSCHEGGNVVCCDNCPRVFHLKCAHIESEPPEDREWLCPICSKMRSSKRRRGESPNNLTELLGLVLKKLKFEGTDQFQQEVREEIAPGYRDLVFHPTDLGKIERNLGNYEATSHLRYEVEWILHNCIIYNGTRHALTKIARQIVKMCRTELSEIEYCSNCYKLSCTRSHEWFSQICDTPHPVVLAKVKGHPQWPGKLINKGRERYEVRFFGREHMRATVPVNSVYPLLDGDSPPPPSNNKTAGYWPDVVSELKLYQANLRKWLLVHPEHKLMQLDVSSEAVHNFTSSISLDMSKPLGNRDLVLGSKVSESEELSLPPMQHTPTIMAPPSSDPTPITIFATNPPPHVAVDLESRLIPKHPSLPKLGGEKDIGAIGGGLRVSETASASEDEIDDPSFKIPGFQPSALRDQKPGGRTRKRRPGPTGDSKQQNKKVVFSAGSVNNRMFPSTRGRGRKIDTGNRKPLNVQFTPHSLNVNDKLNLTSSLKRDLEPLVQDVPLLNSGPMLDLIERNLNLSQKQFEFRPVEEPNPDHIHTKYSKMFLDKFERLILDLISDLSTGQDGQIQNMLDGIVKREEKNRERIYTEVYGDIREEMQRMIKQCHEVAKIEVDRHSSEIKKDCDKRLDQQVRDTKKKTWCSYCWSEAYYNCCWNVNYCSEKCQKLHWVEHKPQCIQILNTTTQSDTSRHRPPAPLDTPSSSREREDNVSMDVSRQHTSLSDHESGAINKRNASIDNSRDMQNNDDQLTSHDRALDYKSPQRFSAPPAAPQINTLHHLPEKVKVEKHPTTPLPTHYANSQQKIPPNTTAPILENSTATTPVHGKPPNFPPINSSQMVSKEHIGHLRYASLSTAPPHQSSRGQQAPAPVPIPGVPQSLSQIKHNNPSVIANSGLAPTTPTMSQKPLSHKSVRETAAIRTGAQSPHPSVNPVMFQAPMEGHPSQGPHSFIIHSGAPAVAGAPTTPTSNQPKVLQAPFHPTVAGPNISNFYQFMNGTDLSANLMMRYPFPIGNQSGLIPNQGALQPNPHSMTPRPHD